MPRNFHLANDLFFLRCAQVAKTLFNFITMILFMKYPVSYAIPHLLQEVSTYAWFIILNDFFSFFRYLKEWLHDIYPQGTMKSISGYRLNL